MKLILMFVLAILAGNAVAQNNFALMPESRGVYSANIRQAPTYVNANALAANTAESQTVPTGAKWVLFSATCDFYAHPTATATVPGDTTNGTASELNPAAWGVVAGATISVISASTCILTMAFYR